MFLGVLAGASRRRDIVQGLGRASQGVRLSPFGPGIRALGIATMTLGLCTFAISAVLPSLAASKASTALLDAASPSPVTVADGESAAKLAASLDPLSDAGPRVEATIAVRDGKLGAAVADLLDAIKREPSDGPAWGQLASVYFALHDRHDGLFATKRELELDPHAQGAPGAASNIGAAQSLLVTPPGASATAAPAGPLVRFGSFLARQPRAELVDLGQQLFILATQELDRRLGLGPRRRLSLELARDLERVGVQSLQVRSRLLQVGIELVGQPLLVVYPLARAGLVAATLLGRCLAAPERSPGHRQRV